MPRVKRRGPAQRRRELSDEEREIFFVGRLANAHAFFASDAELHEAWQFARDALLREWIAARPGTRPPGWWHFEAPREPRERLGGTGTPAHEAFATAEVYNRGVPRGWVGEWDADYYNGRATDVHGNPIGAEFTEGHFPHAPVDPHDPPAFESEPAYLRRLGLLLPGEEERVPPEAFEAVVRVGA